MMQGKVSYRIKKLREAVARRRVYAGYPIEPRIFTGDEVRAYLSGEKITCLLCGHRFRRLGGIHLPKIHGVSEDQYREMYGLPYRVGLNSEDSRAVYAAATKQRIETDGGKLAARLAAGRQKRPLHYPFRRGAYAASDQAARFDKINALRGVSRRWNAADAEAILAQINAGRPECEIFTDPGRPGRTWYREFMRANPEFARRRQEALDAQPFSVQARHCRASGGLPQRFKNEVISLFGKGLSDHKIAAVLGVTAMTCNRITKPLRQRAPA